MKFGDAVNTAMVPRRDLARWRKSGWQVTRGGHIAMLRGHSAVLMTRAHRRPWWLVVRDRLAAALKGLRP